MNYTIRPILDVPAKEHYLDWPSIYAGYVISQADKMTTFNDPSGITQIVQAASSIHRAMPPQTDKALFQRWGDHEAKESGR